MADKPASRPIAKARPAPGGGYYAQFALPGLIPDHVRKGGSVEIFASEDAAANEARRVLFQLLEARTTDTRKAKGYKRMTGAELATALHDAEVTPTEFAEIYGVPQVRVLKWLDGEQDIPHSALVLVKLLSIEENYEEARALTDKARSEGGDDGRQG